MASPSSPPPPPPSPPLLLMLLLCCCSVGPGRGQSSPSWFRDIQTNMFSRSGKVKLGGLFPINDLTSNLTQRTEPDNITCGSTNEYGLGLAIVMKYAVDEINAKTTLLPGVELGYEIFDTCTQSAVVVKPTISFLTSKTSNALSVDCNYTDYETNVVAIIGPQSSEMVSVIGKLLGFFLMPQISFGATSDKFSDKLLYPSFLRTVPSDQGQVNVMGLLLKEFGWNWVAVVGSDEEYGQQGVQEFSKVALQMSVCVAYQGLIPVYTDPTPAVNAIIRNIKATNVNVVVVFSLPEPAEALFKEVIRRNMSGVWIASTSWAIHYHLTSLPGIDRVGTILAFTDRTRDLDLLTAYTMELLTKLSENPRTVDPARTSPDPCPQCWNLSPANISLVTAPAVQRSAFSVYAAVYSVAQALHDMLGCSSKSCPWDHQTQILPWKLLQFLQNTSIDVLGTHLEFDENGNPNIGYNLIEWIWTDNRELNFVVIGSFFKELSIDRSLLRWHTPNSQVPESTCSAECDPGQVRRVKGFHSCCFDCIDCRAGTYQADADDIQCTACPEGQWSTHRSSNCTRPTFQVLSWDTPEALGMALASLLLVLLVLLLLLLFLPQWGTPLVMAMGGPLHYVGLLSLVGTFLSLLLFLGQPGDVGCRLQVPLSSIFQTLTLSIITAISLQISYVTEFQEKAPSRVEMMSGPGRWFFVSACCVLQVALSIYYSVQGPSLTQFMASMKITFVRSFLTCPVEPLVGFALMQGFNCLMALVSFMSTFIAAKPLRQYNLARDITFSTLIYCVFWVTFIPIYIGLSTKNRSVVHVAFVLASNCGLVVAYYFPKCHLLLRKPELNTPEHFCTFLEGAPLIPPDEQPAQPQPAPEK